MIGVNTLPELITSSYGGKLFINKFPWDFQSRAWDCIQAWNFDKIKKEELTGRPVFNHYSVLNNERLKH